MRIALAASGDMLKVERDLTGYLSFGKRERFLTNTLLKALAFAVFFHFFAFMIFHIKPFSPPETTWKFPIVQLDSMISETSDFTSVSQEEILNAANQPYNYSSPSLDETGFTFLQPTIKPELLSIAPISIPQSIYLAEDRPISGLLDNQSNTPHVILKGEFENKKMASTPLLPHSQQKQMSNLAFLGLLDESKGELIDLVPIHDVENQDKEALEAFLPLLIAQLHFEPRMNGVWSTGTIEIVWGANSD